jgi:IS30 family transposase
MSGYTQLTQEQRYQIAALLAAGHSQAVTAQRLGVHKSTISRELKRNQGLRGYRPKQAQRLADNRRKEKVAPRIASETWAWVEQLLREDWSPEQISGWLASEQGRCISHEWIYLYVYEDKRRGGDLHRHLRCQKARRKRYGSNDRRGQIKDRVSIDERPEIVNERSRFGDWEVDTVIGKPGGPVLVTVAERKSRMSLIALAANKTAEAVTAALVASLRPLSNRVYTLTYDNGKEFAHHKTVAEALNADGFFAHPYHSWERGLNENTNGLIRQYLPKGTDFKSITDSDVQKIMHKLNNRPRKCLGFKTPHEVFFGNGQTVALAS